MTIRNFGKKVKPSFGNEVKRNSVIALGERNKLITDNKKFVVGYCNINRG